MTKSITFRVDNDCEMLEVLIDGKVWREGNFWDFDFVQDVPALLDKLGIVNDEEDYTYDEEGEEE